MPRRVFISHASVNATLARAICQAFEVRGITCWIAPRDVAHDGTYGTEIVKGVREADVFLLLLTEAAAQSEAVEREAERAFHYQKRIIPVVIGHAEPGPRLEFYIAGRQLVPCPSSPDEAFLSELAQLVGPHAGHGTDRVATPQVKVAETHEDTSRRGRREFQLAAVAFVVLAAVGGYLALRTDNSPAPAQPLENHKSEQSPPPVVETPQPNTARAPASTSGRTTPRPVPAESSSLTPPPKDVVTTPTPGTVSLPPAAASQTLVTGSARLRFVPVPSGVFSMGCTPTDRDCDDDERPVRRVSVDAFQISATEVTQEIWSEITGNNPSDFRGSALPVQNVSWQDAHEFVEKLNARADGFVYRLPTEAEWEYSARAGDTALSDVSAVAWFGLAVTSSRPSRPQTVGGKAANRWGLLDMLGNVAEWCEDWYSPNYQRVIRGGSWADSAKSVRLSARGRAVPSTRDYTIGLRLVRIRA